MKTLPQKWAWLLNEGAPKILVQALKHYGIMEHGSSKSATSEPNIMKWAKEVGVAGWYTGDLIPWCGLAMGKWAKDAGYPFAAGKLLAAIEWLNWGIKINNDKAMLGDVMIFGRSGGNHVGLYIAESETHFLVYGGNQSNAVGFAFIAKDRVKGVRRSPFKLGQPANIRKILISFDGKLLSTNEA